MDFTYLANILLRRKWLLLSVILISSIATWFFVGKLPLVYKAQSLVSTGIIDYKGVSLQKESAFIQQFQIESSFNGLIEKMKSRISIKLLTDQLLAHDIQADSIKDKPFRQPQDDENGISKADLDDFVLKLKTSNTDSIINAKPSGEQYNNRIAEAFDYDYEALLKKLEIKRVGETDYLSVEFASESPQLSFFVVKTYIEGFFAMHEDDLKKEKILSLNFNTKQVEHKKGQLDAKIQEINNYKKGNNLIDVSHQRESVISHLKDLELKREEQFQNVVALERQIPILNAKILEYNNFNSSDYASKVFFGDDFNKLDSQIKGLSETLVEQIAIGNKNVGAIEAKIEDLKEQRAKLIGKNTPALKETRNRMGDQVRDWIMESLEKSLELEYSKAAVKSFDAEIARQQGRAGKLLTDDNHLATLEAEKDRLEKEYLGATVEYDKAKLYAEGTESPLTVIEPVEMPRESEPSHRVVFSVFAGVASGTLASIFLFLLAFIDSSLQSPAQFQRVTRLPLLGYMNRVKERTINLQHLFTNTQSRNELEIFKENIRKLRTAIENSGSKSFLFVSPKEQEGKSFSIVMLAYALSLNNKRILIIDTNFKNNTLSDFKSRPFYEVATGPAAGKMSGIGTSYKVMPHSSFEGHDDAFVKNIDIVGNKGGNQSPSEVLAGKDFGKIIQQYGKKYDFIFLEAAAANKYSDALELIPFVEKVIAVFSTQSSIGTADKETINVLKGLNGQFLGSILNNVDSKNL